MKKLFLFMMLTLSLYACSQPETNEPEPETTPVDSVANMPDDFDFSIQFGVGKNNEINTFEGTVTKDLIENGTATAEISLTEEEMNQI
ncbi:hypothetical protein GCM10008931_36980 [Oceanobacillus oncorhynchi subsp. oncorhynchi]|uniref:hypothetical protein n=1 Tax=Oceanobacillus oncorhynchi TaxID=545501 RepID=UPI0031D0B44E